MESHNSSDPPLAAPSTTNTPSDEGKERRESHKKADELIAAARAAGKLPSQTKAAEASRDASHFENPHTSTSAATITQDASTSATAPPSPTDDSDSASDCESEDGYDSTYQSPISPRRRRQQRRHSGATSNSRPKYPFWDLRNFPSVGSLNYFLTHSEDFGHDLSGEDQEAVLDYLSQLKTHEKEKQTEEKGRGTARVDLNEQSRHTLLACTSRRKYLNGDPNRYVTFPLTFSGMREELLSRAEEWKTRKTGVTSYLKRGEVASTAMDDSGMIISDGLKAKARRELRNMKRKEKEVDSISGAASLAPILIGNARRMLGEAESASTALPKDNGCGGESEEVAGSVDSDRGKVETEEAVREGEVETTDMGARSCNSEETQDPSPERRTGGSNFTVMFLPFRTR